MRWTTNPRNIYKWHQWFAWYPIRYEGDVLNPSKWIWLEWIETMATEHWGGTSWHYRLPEEE